jgi:streptogramin lyase
MIVCSCSINHPSDNFSTQYTIPVEGLGSKIAIDKNGSLWVPLVLANGTDKVVKFNPAPEICTSYKIPTSAARPAGISSDKLDNMWLAEAGSNSIAKIDPATGNITEYKPKNPSQTLDEPTAVFADPNGFTVYIAEQSTTG